MVHVLSLRCASSSTFDVVLCVRRVDDVAAVVVIGTEYRIIIWPAHKCLYENTLLLLLPLPPPPPQKMRIRYLHKCATAPVVRGESGQRAKPLSQTDMSFVVLFCAHTPYRHPRQSTH